MNEFNCNEINVHTLLSTIISKYRLGTPSILREATDIRGDSS